MAKLKIMSFELIAPVDRRDEITEYLQRKGAVELSVPEAADGFSVVEQTQLASEITAAENTVNAAYDILKRDCPRKKPLTAMLEPRKEMNPKEFSAAFSELDSIIAEAGRVIELRKKADELNAEAVRLQTVVDSLTPWVGFDMPVRSGFTKHTAYMLGTFKNSRTREEILELLASRFPECESVEVEIINSSDLITSVAVFCMKNDVEEVELALRSGGFTKAADRSGGTPEEEAAECRKRIGEVEKEYDECKNALAGCTELYEKFELALDLLALKKDRAAAFEKMPESSRVFRIKGYIAKRDGEKVRKVCEEKYDAAVEITEPGEDEDVPVLLTNNAFSAPLENITGMYSMPGGTDIDPTGIMAFFYYFFFGMMLSDAGYGLLMTLATGGLLLLKRNMEQKMKNTLKMYCFCGISTVFWGAMYGSWFGDAPAVICREFLGKDINPMPPIWTDAVSDLMNVLIVCFILGLVHLFTGVLLKGVADLKNGRKFDAFCDTVPTFLTVIGIAPVFFNLFLSDTMPDGYSALATFIFNAVKTCHNALSTVSTPLLITGIVLVVLTGGRSSKSIGGKIGGGLYEVYNLFGGYLGDVLSYARLLALGLATGVIAQVMNMLGTLPKSQPLKLIMFVIVFIVGHTANLAINVIGAYVHTNRLQYVEFFGKFYEGGGRAFVPLAANTKYYKFKEEKSL